MAIITRQLTDTASASTATDIQLGSCVTEIGQGAFSGYTNITNVEFPESLTTVGVGAFSGSSITSVEFPNGVTSIGDNAFNRCSGLTELTIPSGVTSIGDSAFNRCNKLERINMSGTTVPALGSGAFDNTNSCTIYVPFNSYDDYMADNTWTNYRSRIFYDGAPYKVRFATIDEERFVKCDGNTIASKPSNMPSGITSTTFGECVTDFADKAFQNTSLGDIFIPSNVKYINQMGSGSSYAFYGASATSITFSEGLEQIGYCSFEYFKCPQAITLPSTLSAMSNYAFASSTITGLTINGNPLLELNQYAFIGSSLNFINISNIKTVNGFGRCGNLETVTISNVENIDGTFNSGNLKTVSITGSGSTTINGSFYNCGSLTSVTLGDCVKSMSGSVFYGCSSLPSITIPSGVTTIGSNCFKYCRSLETINLPSGITSIGSSAFQDCAIKNITLPNALETIDSYAFYNCGSLTNVNIPSGVTSIGASAFYNCTSLSAITIPNSVTSIGASAFTNCSNATSLSIGSGVTTIGDRTFSGCTSLESVEIPNTVISIGASAFTKCTNLKSLIIPSSVISIGTAAFSGCSGLTSILMGRDTPPTLEGANVFAESTCLIYVPADSYDLYISAENWATYKDRIYAVGMDYKAMIIGSTPKVVSCNDNTTLSKSEIGSVTATTINVGDCVDTIGASAFTSVSDLQTVSIPSGVTSIGDYVFYYRRYLTTVDGGDNVTTIGDNAFQGCSALTSYNFSSGLTSIGKWAFCGNTAMSSDIVLPSGFTSIGEGALQSPFNSIRFLSTTPLDLSGYTSYGYYCPFDSGTTLYVPCAAYDDYMTAWNNTSSKRITNNIVAYGNYSKSEVVEGEYICEDGVKYEKVGRYVSSDNVDWCLVDYVKGSPISDGSMDCTPRISVTYTGGSCSATTTVVLCSGQSSTLTVSEIDSVEYCESNGNITIGDCVSELEDKVFSYEMFNTITLPNTIIEIPYSAFTYCSATTINLGDAVTSIGNAAFMYCSSLTSIDIPDSVTSIGASAFTNCSGLTSIEIPDSVTSVGNSAFRDCSGMTSCTIGSGVTSIGASAFYSCTSLSAITIPNSVTSIGDYAFNRCSSATSLSIGSGVTSIGNNAFYNCSGLTSVTMEATTPPTLGSSLVFYDTNNCPIYVPEDSVDTYKAATNWSTYADRIQAIPTS